MPRDGRSHGHQPLLVGHRVAASLVALALLGGCGSSAPAGRDAAVKDALLRGVGQIRGSQDRAELRGQLVRTLARLRSARRSTAAGRRGRTLAIEGFTSTLKGLDAQRDLIEKDHGNIEAAVRDAKRADRRLNRGANLLRAAGRALRLRIGTLNGH